MNSRSPGRWWATSVFWIRSVGQRYHVAMNSHLLQLNPIEISRLIYNCICFQTQNVLKWCALFNANSTVLASTPSNTNLYLAAPSQAEWANDSLMMLHLTRAGTPQKRPHPLQIPISTHVPTESHNALSPKTDCNGTRSRGRSAALQASWRLCCCADKIWGNSRAALFGGSLTFSTIIVIVILHQGHKVHYNNHPKDIHSPKFDIAPEKMNAWKQRSCLSFWETNFLQGRAVKLREW